MASEGLSENRAIERTLLFVSGVITGIISGLGMFEVASLIFTFTWTNKVIVVICLLVAILCGMGFGSLLILHNVLFPRSKYRISKLINPMSDEELKLLYDWAHGTSVKDLDVHPMQLNRLSRKYVRMTLKRVKNEHVGKIHKRIEKEKKATLD
ncbi:MAG: hypothetical protein QXU45_01915 [Candidatus Bathyarchaeia archaeon]